MPSATQKGLTGAWAGKYSYSVPQGPAVPFNAWLTDELGALGGDIVEPNTFAPTASDTLMAGITGRRDGDDVIFSKRYSDIDVEEVHYVGTANAALTRISGHWSIPDFPGVFGEFMMVREARRARDKAREMEAT